MKYGTIPNNPNTANLFNQCKWAFPIPDPKGHPRIGGRFSTAQQKQEINQHKRNAEQEARKSNGQRIQRQRQLLLARSASRLGENCQKDKE